MSKKPKRDCNAEEFLKNSLNIQNYTEEFFNIFDSIDLGIYFVNPETYEITIANNTAKKFLGSEPIGKKCYEVLLKGSNVPCAGCNNKDISIGKTQDTELPWEFKSDDRCYQRSTKIIRWPGNGLTKMEVIMDITESKKMERELNHLRVFKEKVEDLPHVPVLVFGRRGKITLMNNAARNLLEYNDEDMEFLHIWHILDEKTRETIYNLTEQLSGGDRETLDCTILGKNSKLETNVDILFHRDIKGTFIEGTMFMIEKPKKIIRFY